MNRRKPPSSLSHRMEYCHQPAFYTAPPMILSTYCLHSVENKIFGVIPKEFSTATWCRTFHRTTYNKIIYWLDNDILHSKTVDERLGGLERFFQSVCNMLPDELERCVLYYETIQLCGRLVSLEGIRFYLARIDERKKI